jgi:2-keto-4-pentenoate hydratase/2-oxohepta-3-ene-1,7-dioic acid hydratase in catechol pathway
MRIANLNGRLVLLTVDGAAVDVEQLSGGRFSAHPQAVYDRWSEYREWAAELESPVGVAVAVADLGSPAPAPRQVFGIGLNYRAHPAESGFAVTRELPPVFTKYTSSITGPVSRVRLPEDGHTDWSFPGFTPMGPWLVTPDEFADPDDLELGCSINGEEVQKGRTGDLIFSVPVLISKLSAVLPLLPGDVIFTGTPAGVGSGRTPQRFLADGEELVSYVEGIGELHQTFYAG